MDTGCSGQAGRGLAAARPLFALTHCSRDTSHLPAEQFRFAEFGWFEQNLERWRQAASG